ncbi:hypothetical protein [Kitasatospora paranensis]|uniref:hypothetical protein n=1 Tax=Kitasatospora paranensis TaxID=258053 RepID=UPI0031E6CDB1
MTDHADTFAVRVAGLPATVLDRLVDQRLRQALMTAARTEAGLTADAAALSDRCHTVIGALPDPSAKPKLVALRRTVHQLRDPARLLADPRSPPHSASNSPRPSRSSAAHWTGFGPTWPSCRPCWPKRTSPSAGSCGRSAWIPASTRASPTPAPPCARSSGAHPGGRS